MPINTIRALWLLVVAITLVACAPERKFNVLDAEPVSLLTSNKTLYINYWAVWCAPCIEEMPVLAEFRETYSDQVEVYGVNFDAPPSEQLREDVRKLNVQIPILLDDPSVVLGAERPLGLQLH